MAQHADEIQRLRKRAHDTEGTLLGVVNEIKYRNEERARAEQKQMRWIQFLTLIVGLAGVIGPVVYTGAAH